MVITGDDEPKTEMPTELEVPPLSVELNSYGFPQGYFMLRCIGAARVLDVAQGFVEDGTDVILWHPTDSSQVECEFVTFQLISFGLRAQTVSCIYSHEKAGIKQPGPSPVQCTVQLYGAEYTPQVFFIDTSGALSSRSSGHAIDVESASTAIFRTVCSPSHAVSFQRRNSSSATGGPSRSRSRTHTPTHFRASCTMRRQRR